MNLLDIGTHIESLGLNKENFSSECFKFLNQTNIDLDLEQIEDLVIKWSEREGELPDQVNVYNGFGQPPVTLFNNAKFVVDIYFWQTLDTSIHSHSFCGAFKLLHGESRHEVFKVNQKEFYFDDIFKSELKLITDERLIKGDTREIKRGLDFSHRVLHEHNPTVTLCIRTINDKTEQWHHFENGLSIQKRSPSASDIKRLSIFDYLLHQNEKRAMSYLKSLMNRFSPSLIMNLYEQLSYDQMGLQEASVEVFFERVVQKFGHTPWYKTYMESFQE